MSFSRKSAFTLFELLVTMAVISIIAGTGFYTIAKSTKDRALERAADTLHSMIRIARTQAITNGVHARLIINADSSDPESYLRRIGVVLEGDHSILIEEIVEGEDSSTIVEKSYDSVLAVERGALLPEGVFLVPQGSNVIVSSGFPRSIYRKENSDASDGTAIYGFDYPMKAPVPVDVSDSTPWITIQFAPNGRLSSATPGGSGLVPRSNQLILAKGSWVGGKLDFSSAKRYLGIAFKLSGSSFSSQDSALFELEKDVVEEGDADVVN